MNIWSLPYLGLKIREKVLSKIISSYYKKFFSVRNLYIQYPCRIIGKSHIKLQNSFRSLSGLRLECFDNYNGEYYTPLLVIGKNVSFNSNCHIGCINEVVIGNNVLIGSNVLITDHSHGRRNIEIGIPPSEKKLWSKGKISIGDRCWIGENVCILPNVNIGNDCIIGAGSVITKDIPPFSTVVGNPQKIICSDSSSHRII